MPGLTVAALYVLPDGPYAASTRMRPLAPDYARPTADEVDQYGNGPCGCPCHDEHREEEEEA